MKQLQWVDLSAAPTGGERLVHLSSPDDARWAGLHRLAPFDRLSLAAATRQDVYLIQGQLQERASAHTAGAFFSRCAALTLTAGPQGAVFFMYRDASLRSSGLESWASHELDWQAGAVPGMAVAPLSRMHHRLALVSWQAGTRAAAHTHPFGEEILVLSGELRDERGAYTTGRWLRFPPGSGHAPYAEQATLILLRNGHLG